MAKLNLYIPHPSVKDKWQQYADKEKRTLSDFIRLAVDEKIQRMEDDE
jgi:hypothetical protein